jgi:hypothetical protein
MKLDMQLEGCKSIGCLIEPVGILCTVTPWGSCLILKVLLIANLIMKENMLTRVNGMHPIDVDEW